MDVIFLDQNKWIELARVEAGKVTSGPLITLYTCLKALVNRGEIIFPLSVSHIIETSRRNDQVSRAHLAKTQAALSKGRVLRSRKARLLMEIRAALLKAFGEPLIALPDHCAIVPGFMQAFEHYDELSASPYDVVTTRHLNTHIDPRELLYNFLTNQNDEDRRQAIAAFSANARDLISQFERRRHELQSVNNEMRWRIYGAKLFDEHQSLICKQLVTIGKSIDDLKALGDSVITALLDNIPTLNVERNLAVKLETQSRSLNSNDLLDMYSMCAAIPYSTHVVAEKMFISLARQCKLDSAYKSTLSTELSVLADLYCGNPK